MGRGCLAYLPAISFQAVAGPIRRLDVFVEAGDVFHGCSAIILLQPHQVGVERLEIRTNLPELGVDRGEVEIRLVDIALLSQHRNVGIGSALLKDLLSEAQSTGKPVRLHVETSNRAMRLYERLGFTVLEERGIYQFMEWRSERH